MSQKATYTAREPRHAITPTDAGREPLEFNLSPKEKQLATMGTLHLERERRERNRRDAAKQTVRELEELAKDLP